MSYGNYPDLKNVKKILVVKMRHLGDVLLASPVFSCLKTEFKDATIDALIYKDTYPMLQGHLGISNYLLHERKKCSFFKKILRDFKLYRTIRKNKYDLVINLTEGDRGALAAIASKAPIRVGFESGKKGFVGKRKAFTHVVKNCPTPRHSVEKDLDALRKIGIFPEEAARSLSFVVPDDDLRRVSALLNEKGVQEKQLIVIHPTSRWRFKCWPASHVSRLIIELHKLGYPVAITSGKEAYELNMVNEILQRTKEVPVYNFAGKFSLKEFGALLQLSKALISVDTVAPHIACSLKTPLVVLFGPSSVLHWGPWMHPKSLVVSKKLSCQPCHLDGCGGSKMSDCLYTLEVKPVLDALKNLLT